MKQLWYAVAVLLMLSVLAGLSDFSPTGAFVVNTAPSWVFFTNEFHITQGRLRMNLAEAFSDANADALIFSAKTPTPGIYATVTNSILDITAENAGQITIVASDGKERTEQVIILKRN